MKNKDHALNGMGKVYGFTLRQLFRSKANIISFGILILLAVGFVPVFCMIKGGADPGQIIFTGSSLMSAEDYLSGGDLDFGTRYAIQYGYSIVVMVLCIFACTYIVRSVVEEKASKLVEMLIVSVKPLALIFGKILAVMTYIFAMLIVMIVSFGLSYFISGIFIDVSPVGDLLAGLGFTSGALNVDPLTVVIALISLAIAYLTFSLVSGLAGAGCSSMEDVESANMAAMMLILAGYLVSCFTMGFGGMVSVVLSLIPVVSAFAAPVYYVLGDIGLGVMALSWVIQIVFIILILILCSRVYDSLIMYRGSRLKFGQIFSMAKKTAKGKGAA